MILKGGGGGGLISEGQNHREQGVEQHMCIAAQQKQEKARSTKDAEPNEGCTNEPTNVREAWGVIMNMLLGLHAHNGKTQ